MENLPEPVLWRGYAEIRVEDSPTTHHSLLQNYTPHMPGGKHKTGQKTQAYSQTRWQPSKSSHKQKHETYPEITAKSMDSAFVLSQISSYMTILHRVPSLVNIEGNERADTLAKEATNLTNILHTEQTPGAYKHIITNFLQKQIRPN